MIQSSLFDLMFCSKKVWWIKSFVDPPQKPEKIVEELDLDTRCKVKKTADTIYICKTCYI